MAIAALMSALVFSLFVGRSTTLSHGSILRQYFEIQIPTALEEDHTHHIDASLSSIYRRKLSEYIANTNGTAFTLSTLVLFRHT